MSGSDVNYPQPSPEERSLQQEQVNLLRLQTSQLNQALRFQELLAPQTFAALGLKPIYAESTAPIDNEIATLQAQIESLRSDTPTGDGFAEIFAKDSANQQIEALQRQITDLEDRRGEPIGFEEDPDSPQARLKAFQLAQIEGLDPAIAKEVNELTQQRQLAALKGELPVDPTLERNLTEQEGALRERLRRNLGSGFETSTPGISALAEFGKRREEVLAGARRGEITLGDVLSRNNLVNTAATADLFGGLRESRVGDIFRATSSPLAFLQPAQGISGGFSGPLSNLAQQRQGQFGANQVNAANDAAQMQSLGTLAGLLGYAAIASARWLKKEIVKLFDHPRGFGIYAFRYVWGGPMMVGVMADEVPHAVVVIDGIPHVDYRRL